MNLPRLRAKFHDVVKNSTAPGGQVAMYHLSDPENGETYMSLAVPMNRHDWARDVAIRCSLHPEMVELLRLCAPVFHDLGGPAAVLADRIDTIVKKCEAL